MTKDERKEYMKIYYSNNKNKFNDKNYQKEYSINNRETLKEYHKNYSEQYEKENRKSISLRKLNYVKRKYKTDYLYKLKHDIRNKIRKSLKKREYTKKAKTNDILGCSFEEFKLYLESKFEPWMTWENYGNWNGIPTQPNIAWDIDHITPLSSAITEADIIKLNHYTNLQPLCSYVNRVVKRNLIF